MPNLEPLVPHLPAFLVVLSRIAGLVMFTPLLSSLAIPVQVKAAVVMAFTAAVYPTIDTAHLVGLPLTLGDLFPLIVFEAAVGMTVGVLAAIPLLSVQLGGMIMGLQMGLGFAQLVDPSTDVEGESLGQLLNIIAMVIFVSVGGLEIVFMSVVATFDTLPAGGFGPEIMPLDLLVGLISSGFDMAMRVAMPVLTIIFIETVAVGFLMKTVPSLNIMSFGFPIRIAVGVLGVTASIYLISAVIAGEIKIGLDIVQQWVMEVEPGKAFVAPAAHDGAGG